LRSLPELASTVLTLLPGLFLRILPWLAALATPNSKKAQAAAPRYGFGRGRQSGTADVPVTLPARAVTAFNTANIKGRVDGQIMQVNVGKARTETRGC